MFLSITSETPPAADLGYLLHKNPATVQEFPLGIGVARAFYPEASDSRCTFVLMVEVDPVEMVRSRAHSVGDASFSLAQYVNDRPYTASSFLSVAIAQVIGTALQGRSKERPELAASPLDLTLTVAAVPAPGGEALLRELFEPLGYQVAVHGVDLDPLFPEWERSRSFRLELRARRPLREALAHLYVLIPVLDDAKHYWVSKEEVEKLLRHGEGWLESHPRKEWIVDRYLRRIRSLTSDALARLDDGADPEEEDAANAAPEERAERPMSLHQQRIGAVLAALRATGARSVADLGCGEGQLLLELLRDPAFERILGIDVSNRSLEKAADRLRLDRMPPMVRARLTLAQGSLVYRDPRFEGFDAAALVEVVEHIDPMRLGAFERVVFEFARPRAVVLTTPNREYNGKFEFLPAGSFRHGDHRFEWDRGEFAAWSDRVAAEHGYRVRRLPLGPEDPAVGAPSQMAIFER